MKFSKLEIGTVFQSAIINGLSRNKIGSETMKKINNTHVLVIATTWDIPETDAIRRLGDSTGTEVIMLTPGFDPEI